MAIDITGVGNQIVSQRSEKFKAQLSAAGAAVDKGQEPLKIGLSASALTQNATASISSRGIKLDLNI